MFTVFGVPTPTPSSSSSDKASPPPQPRPKRAQVSRACDWCRLTRVKCDTVRPCRNCKEAKRECVNAGRDDFKSVAAATKEVQKLRKQVQELEAKLMTPSLQGESSHRHHGRIKWKGVKKNGIQYGPSSLNYFTHRLSTYTRMAMPQNSFSVTLSASPLDSMPSPGRLQRQQQDILLDLFWQGHHAVYPILDEACFRKHYASLWENQSSRKPCPLVDSALALCIQFGSTYMSCGSANGDIPGRDFYLRAQFYLSQNPGAPSLVTVQCYFLNALYLLSTDQLDSAYSMTGTAVRIAQSLGLQHKSTDDDEPVDLNEEDCKRRLWSCLVMLDTQISLHLGRPFAVHDLPPADLHPDSDLKAQAIGPTYTLGPELGLNWLRFQHERRRMFDLVREIHEEFYAACESVLDGIDGNDFYAHPASREKCAQFLFQKLKKLKHWAEELPGGLKTQRRDGIPMSTDRSGLDLSNSDPLWLQRQRLILELEYHTFAIILRRPFISFLPTPALGTLSSDNHCIVSGNSAVAITNMLHQVLRDTDILTGWYQVSDWQLNAVFAMAGFTCGYPICPLSPTLRRSILTAKAVFELAKAADKAELSEQLKDKTFEILTEFGHRIGITSFVPTTPSPLCHGASAAAAAPLASADDVPSAADPDLSTMDLGDKTVGDCDGLVGVDAENLWVADCSGAGGTLLWGDLLKDLGVSMTPLGEAASLPVSETI